jgi:carboxymethylenebutenolidase
MFLRRTVLTGLAGLSLTPLFAGSSARGATGLESVTTNGVDGKALTGLLAVPSTTPAPAVLMLHGSHGMSPWYQSTAVEFGKQGFVCLVFQYWWSSGAKDIAAWVEWLRSDQRTNGKLAIVGYSQGAEFALRAATSMPVDATVLYAGMAQLTVDELAHLKGPVLGLIPERGNDPNPENVKGLEERMKEAGKSFEVHWYSVGHAFANPEFSDYNKAAADAWASTVEFLDRNLR